MLVLAVACDLLPGEEPRGELLAAVGERELFSEDVADVLPRGLSPGDSVQQLREWVDRWVRDAALVVEAEASFGDDPEIERLVDDYRSSLLVDRYRDRLYATGAGDTLTDDQLREEYERAGGAVTLDEPLVRATLIKVQTPVPDKDEFERAWYSASGDEHAGVVRAYAKTYANLALLDEAAWLRLDELVALLPAGMVGSVQVGTRVAQRDGFAYYLRVLERAEAGQPAPWSYVRPRLRATARQQARAAFLAERAEASYQSARRRDDVKIYLDE